MAKKNEIAVVGNVGDQVIARVDELNKVGFSIPKDYNYVNAIKASLLVLQDLKDKDKKPALEVCSQNSIASALFEMSVKGLDASKKTCYFLVRGSQLCMHESYFGKVLQVKRIYPDFDPHVMVIHEGDEFEFEVDNETGCKKVVKHIQKLENLDKDFVGAYMYLPTAKGGQDLYIMTKKMILTAWSKSSSFKQTVHNEFREKMITKTVINSGCNMIINSTPDLANSANMDEQNENEVEQTNPVEDAKVEVIDDTEDVVDVTTGEIVEEEKPKEEVKEVQTEEDPF